MAPPKAVIDLVDDYGDPLDRDLSYYHGVDFVADFFGGAISPERMLSRIARLPEDSSFNAARLAKKFGRAETDFRGWTTDRLLAARLTTYLAWLTYAKQQENSKKKLTAPTPIPTPFDDGAAESKTSQFARMLQAAREARAARE
ncbi:hypothetical protein FPZ12_029590 [Amycolatopsis acidicola]|uniref:Tail assembly chaperone n=1 Tax=Amycolatopsis acidicola TaxID=2596893 RepID=A0A5N0UWX5_9PSEU|nr:hypothetical protein [Amycolatopsis acidicola]KAA9155551.1 hypothetical protein FPZ12_029590 [Amycolatopsis acidicola]